MSTTTPPAPSPAAVARASARLLPSVPSGSDGRLDEMRSIFADHASKIYQYRYAVQLHVGKLVGGTPTDPDVAGGWVRTKMGITSEEAVTAAVEEVMKKTPGLTAEAAMDEVAARRNLSGFKRRFDTPTARMVQRQAVERGIEVLDRDGKTKTLRRYSQADAERIIGELLIEGRQIKAMIKEAAMISVGAGHIEARGWGATKKSMLNFLVEHMFVPDDEVLLGVTDPSEVNQSFVHTWRGSGIKLEEVLRDAVVDFELLCDYDFTAKERDFFKTVFVVGEQNGLGASRSQGFGRFKVTKFDKLGA
jgi:hypothetical protein